MDYRQECQKAVTDSTISFEPEMLRATSFPKSLEVVKRGQLRQGVS